MVTLFWKKWFLFSYCWRRFSFSCLLTNSSSRECDQIVYTFTISKIFLLFVNLALENSFCPIHLKSVQFLHIFSISQFCISVWFKTFIITKRPSKPVARNIKMRKQKCFNYKDLVTKNPGWALFDSYTFISQWKIQNWWDAISRGEEFSISNFRSFVSNVE